MFQCCLCHCKPVFPVFAGVGIGTRVAFHAAAALAFHHLGNGFCIGRRKGRRQSLEFMQAGSRGFLCAAMGIAIQRVRTAERWPHRECTYIGESIHLGQLRQCLEQAMVVSVTLYLRRQNMKRHKERGNHMCSTKVIMVPTSAIRVSSNRSSSSSVKGFRAAHSASSSSNSLSLRTKRPTTVGKCGSREKAFHDWQWTTYSRKLMRTAAPCAHLASHSLAHPNSSVEAKQPTASEMQQHTSKQQSRISAPLGIAEAFIHCSLSYQRR